MAASKTKLTKYIGKDGAAIFAAKITEMVPFTQVGAPPGSATLKFGELGKRSNLIGAWVAQNNPQVGGYFVVYDTPEGQTLCRFESAERVAQEYTRAS